MALFGKNKTNQAILEKQDKMKQGKHRDVFNTQQLERGELKAAQTMKGRNILNGVLTFFVVLIVWLGISAFDRWRRAHSPSISPWPSTTPGWPPTPRRARSIPCRIPGSPRLTT